jgi:putative spermidine/putrescine transport system permease protein
MSTQAPTQTVKKQSKSLSTLLMRKPKLRLIGLLALPMTWIVGVYIASLFLLLITAFWEVDSFTSLVTPGFTLEHFINIFTVPAYLATSFRTLLIALAVTFICILFAVPLGIFMAKIAKPWLRNFLAVAITLPLWAGYLVKIIAMRLVFTEEGFFNWLMNPLGISGPGFSIPIVIITLTYLWFPYMALPVYTAIRQIPPNLFDASSDLGLYLLLKFGRLPRRPLYRRLHPDDRQHHRHQYQSQSTRRRRIFHDSNYLRRYLPHGR